MRTKILFLIVIMSSLISNLFSQTDDSKFKVLLGAGVINSKIKNEYKLISSWGYITNTEKSKQQLISGLGFEYNISKSFSIQTGVYLSFPRSESTITMPDDDTLFVNWKQVPRKFESITEYKLLSVPIDIKFNFFHTNKITFYLKYGIQVNSVVGYKCAAKETYFDTTILYYDTSYEKDYFSKYNFSMIGSVGSEYDIFRKFYLGVEIYYNYMFDYINGREAIKDYPYKFGVNDLGLMIIFGYKL